MANVIILYKLLRRQAAACILCTAAKAAGVYPKTGQAHAQHCACFSGGGFENTVRRKRCAYIHFALHKGSADFNRGNIMGKLKGACVIGQSGGPTSVINASAYGVIKLALEKPEITRVLFAQFGVQGILTDDLYDMGKESAVELELLTVTPASYFGACRYRLKDPDEDEGEYERILEIFKKYNIRYFFYIGGNDSMDTCAKVSRYMKKVGYECRVMGVPKTIDNDLALTDHCPGFGSAAKYIATSCMEVSRDMHVYTTGEICIMEIMGRNAGWLTAAGSLASKEGFGPDLIYLPEVPFNMEDFLDTVQKIYDEDKYCFVVVSEGLKYANGRYVAEGNGTVDAFGHNQFGGIAAYLAKQCQDRTNGKVRSIEPSLLQRCAGHLASQTDIDEAVMAGRAAVHAAVDSAQSGKMVAFKREYVLGQYECSTVLVDVNEVANAEKVVPREWINEEGNNVTDDVVDYIKPLILGEPRLSNDRSLPRFARLKLIKTKDID